MGGVHSPKEYRRIERGLEIGQYFIPYRFSDGCLFCPLHPYVREYLVDAGVLEV